MPENNQVKYIIDKVVNSVGSLFFILLIMWGYTYLLIKLVSWTQERLPFQEEQQMAGIFIWIYSLMYVVKIWGRGKK